MPEPERLRPGRCMHPRAGLGGFPAENLEPELCGQGEHMQRDQGQAQCGRDTASTCQCYLQHPSLPPNSATEQVSLKKKVSSTVPFVSGRKPDTEETSKQKKL